MNMPTEPRRLEDFGHEPLRIASELARQPGDILPLRDADGTALLLKHPDAIRAVLVERRDSFRQVPRLKEQLRPFEGASLLLAEHAAWSERRQFVQQVTRAYPLGELAAIATACTDRSMTDWPGTGAMALVPWSEQIVTRTLLRAIFDVALQPETATLLESFLVARASAAALAVGVGNTSAVFAEPAPSRQTIDKLLLGARRALPNERAGTCLYDRLLSAHAGPGQDRHSDSPPHLDEAVSLLTAGRDTTAAALAWTLLTIARRPAIAERVAHEVTAWTRENPAHPGHAELPYLNTVIQESLRLFPPNWLLVVREAVENVELGGRTIPAQSRVSILPIVVHRDNRWFNHPEEFLPERFVASRRPPIRPGTYIPFGLGPRSCLGTRWATTIVRSAVAATVQRFTLADPSPQSALAAEATIVVKPARSTRLAIQRKTPWTAS